MSKNSSLTHRMDVRTKEEFAEDIKTYTGIEGFVMNKWIEEMNAMGIPTDAAATGCDNTGELIEGFVGVNHDYRVYMQDNGDRTTVLPVDVKHNYNDATATFKDHNLKAYIQNHVWMLLIIGTGLNGRELLPPAFQDAWNASFGRRKWALVSPAQINTITEVIPCKRIKFMGNRPGYMLFARQFDDFFDLHEFEKV